MINPKRKQFRDEDYNADDNYNPSSEDIGYDVGEKFDEAGLPNPYIEDEGAVDDPNDDRDGRGLPTSLAVSTNVEKPQEDGSSSDTDTNEAAK